MTLPDGVEAVDLGDGSWEIVGPGPAECAAAAAQIAGAYEVVSAVKHSSPRWRGGNRTVLTIKATEAVDPDVLATPSQTGTTLAEYANAVAARLAQRQATESAAPTVTTGLPAPAAAPTVAVPPAGAPASPPPRAKAPRFDVPETTELARPIADDDDQEALPDLHLLVSPVEPEAPAAADRYMVATDPSLLTRKVDRDLFGRAEQVDGAARTGLITDAEAVQWSRASLRDAGLPAQVMRRLPVDDPDTPAGWVRMLLRLARSVLEEAVPVPARSPVPVDASGAVEILRVATVAGARMPVLEVDGHAGPATPERIVQALATAMPPLPSALPAPTPVSTPDPRESAVDVRAQSPDDAADLEVREARFEALDIAPGPAATEFTPPRLDPAPLPPRSESAAAPVNPHPTIDQVRAQEWAAALSMVGESTLAHHFAPVPPAPGSAPAAGEAPDAPRVTPAPSLPDGSADGEPEATGSARLRMLSGHRPVMDGSVDWTAQLPARPIPAPKDRWPAQPRLAELAGAVAADPEVAFPSTRAEVTAPQSVAPAAPPASLSPQGRPAEGQVRRVIDRADPGYAEHPELKGRLRHAVGPVEVYVKGDPTPGEPAIVAPAWLEDLARETVEALPARELAEAQQAWREALAARLPTDSGAAVPSEWQRLAGRYPVPAMEPLPALPVPAEVEASPASVAASWQEPNLPMDAPVEPEPALTAPVLEPAPVEDASWEVLPPAAAVTDVRDWHPEHDPASPPLDVPAAATAPARLSGPTVDAQAAAADYAQPGAAPTTGVEGTHLVDDVPRTSRLLTDLPAPATLDISALGSVRPAFVSRVNRPVPIQDAFASLERIEKDPTGD